MDPILQALTEDDDDDGYVRLGRAVIAQAIHDCTRRATNGAREDNGYRDFDATTARTFLSEPSAGLAFWSALAGIDPSRIIAGYWRHFSHTRPVGTLSPEKKERANGRAGFFNLSGRPRG